MKRTTEPREALVRLEQSHENLFVHYPQLSHSCVLGLHEAQEPRNELK